MNSVTLTAIDGDVREEAATGPQPHRHMPSLDGLRGVAILLVLTHHFVASLDAEFSVNQRLSHWSQLGWTGVDLFFVLSGFLITGILYDAKSTPHFFRNFYARRALRIFPLYYIALALVISITPLLALLKLDGSANPAWISIYATNFVISAKGLGAFGVLDHFWSLAVEEHFYFVWPAIVFCLNRRWLMMVAACACVIAPCLRLAAWNGDHLLPVAAYVLTPMRMDSLAAGAFIALFVRGPRGMTGLVRPAMMIAAAALALFLAMVAARGSKEALDPVIGTAGFTALWMFYGALLVLSLNWKPLETLMSLPVLRWFGKYSYGMYVWHPIVLMLVFHNDPARQLRHGNGHLAALLSGIVGLAAVFAVTLASWHLMEKQFLKMKSRFA
jgi:peptidoglycan/LPS O-acetylase OafA/YrhL